MSLEKQKQQKEESFSSINIKSFVVVAVLLIAILAVCGAMSYFIPQGYFDRDASGAIIDGTYHQEGISGIEIWRILTAPFRVFGSVDGVSIIFISIFLLIMSGVFNLLEKTGGIRIFISKIVQKFAKKRSAVICIAALIFMAFGSFFGMFEELVTLLPLVVICMLSLGMDTLTGLGICMLGACFGFSAAITNPFSVGLAASFAGTFVLDGAWLRILFFVLIYALVCAFLLHHVKRITKNPEKSLTYQIDLEKRKNLDLGELEDSLAEHKVFNVFAIFFGVQFVTLVLIASVRAISSYAIPLLSVSFLLGAIVAGCFVCEKKRDVAKHMWQIRYARARSAAFNRLSYATKTM